MNDERPPNARTRVGASGALGSVSLVVAPEDALRQAVSRLAEGGPGQQYGRPDSGGTGGS